MHQFMPPHIYDAVKYLGNAKCPMLSPHVAMDLLVQLDKLAEQCVRLAGKDNVLQLVDTLQHMRTYQVTSCEADMDLTVRLVPENGGVRSADLGNFIEDMISHHFHDDQSMPDSTWQANADMLHIPVPRINVGNS